MQIDYSDVIAAQVSPVSLGGAKLKAIAGYHLKAYWEGVAAFNGVAATAEYFDSETAQHKAAYNALQARIKAADPNCPAALP